MTRGRSQAQVNVPYTHKEFNGIKYGQGPLGSRHFAWSGEERKDPVLPLSVCLSLSVDSAQSLQCICVRKGESDF